MPLSPPVWRPLTRGPLRDCLSTSAPHSAGPRFRPAPLRTTQTFNRNEFGWTTRANFGFDIASNTAYGPLIGHFDINSETGNAFDNVNATYLNTGYLTWAGITAGKAQSFYSFTGGGDNWANFASPDQKGFNEPDLIAYTASFGGGFTATIAAQSAGPNGVAEPRAAAQTLARRITAISASAA